MTDPAPAAKSEAGRQGRVIFALRQAALLAVALLVAGLVTQRLEPVDVASRGFVSTPFLWAIVLWFAVLMFHAVAFEDSQMSQLEGWPLLGGLGIGMLVFVFGLIALDSGSALRRIIFLFANSLGAVMFWWAILSLISLSIQRFNPAPTNQDSGRDQQV